MAVLTFPGLNRVLTNLKEVFDTKQPNITPSGPTNILTAPSVAGGQPGALPVTNLASSTDFLSHTSDNIIHVSQQDRDRWDAPAGGKRFATVVVGLESSGYSESDVDVFIPTNADSAPYLQTAVNMLPNSRGEVVLLEGTYLCTTTWVINPESDSSIFIRGMGGHSTKFTQPSTSMSSPCFIRIEASNITGSKTTLKGLSLAGLPNLGHQNSLLEINVTNTSVWGEPYPQVFISECSFNAYFTILSGRVAKGRGCISLNSNSGGAIIDSCNFVSADDLSSTSPEGDDLGALVFRSGRNLIVTNNVFKTFSSTSALGIRTTFLSIGEPSLSNITSGAIVRGNVFFLVTSSPSSITYGIKILPNVVSSIFQGNIFRSAATDPTSNSTQAYALYAKSAGKRNMFVNNSISALTLYTTNGTSSATLPGSAIAGAAWGTNGSAGFNTRT